MNPRTHWPALLAMVAVGMLAGCSRTATVNGGGASGSISAEGQALLSTTIASGKSALHWPDFSDYSTSVKKFYDSNGNSLAWVKDSTPTPQARQVIALLLHADKKGLSPEDYDGSLWSDRLATLKPATPNPDETNAVKFDLALTVGLMRYISDLHIGKLNPKHLDFAFDQESKKYDLADFLKTRMAGAADVASVLAQVEPPYPAYRRLLQALETYTELAIQDDGEQLPPATKTVAPGDRRHSTAYTTAAAGRRPAGGRRSFPGWHCLRRCAGGRCQEVPAQAGP